MRSLRQIAAFLTGRGHDPGGAEPGACCGSDAAPDEAAAAEPFLPDEIAGPDPALMESGALVRHIVARYHEVHRREIAELVRLAAHVEAAHRDHPAAPLGLADLLASVRSEMEQHMKKEEQGLFPGMALAESPDMEAAIAIMRDEHGDHETRLRRLAALTRDHTPPADACRTWRALCAGTRKFAADLRQHIDLENNVLFPRFAKASAG